MKSIKYRANGVTTLLMHSDVTANPLHPFSKELKSLTSKRKKTDEDYEKIARVEFNASVYWHKENGYYMPAKNIDATLLASAKMFKLGVLWKQGAFVDTDADFVFPHAKLEPSVLYDHENGLYRDMQTVKVGQAKTVRCRPAFNKWSFEFTIIIDEAKFNERQIDEIVINAGKYVGICDYRPRYGKFDIEKIK